MCIISFVFHLKDQTRIKLFEKQFNYSRNKYWIKIFLFIQANIYYAYVRVDFHSCNAILMKFYFTNKQTKNKR